MLDLLNTHTNILFQCAGSSFAPKLPLRKVATGLWFTAIAMTVNVSIADYYLETLQTFYSGTIGYMSV